LTGTGNNPVVAREISNLSLETPDRFTVRVDQQQWHALAVGFVVEASAVEDKRIASRRIAAVGNIGGLRVSACNAATAKDNKCGYKNDAGDGEPGVHYFPLRRLMAGAVTSRNESCPRSGAAVVRVVGLRTARTGWQTEKLLKPSHRLLSYINETR
jgi:hypothetical protein